MRGTLLAGVMLALVAPAAPAFGQSANQSVTSITVFGDSLVDAGNVNTLNLAVASPAAGYFDGRFTNGYDYTDLLSISLFGTPTTASLEGGTNFAFGGARATNTSGVPDLGEQLGLFQGYLAGGGEVDETGLYVLNFGGNDIFNALGTGAPAGYESDSAYLLAAATSYAQGVQTLADLGATNFLITGFPNPVPLSLEAEGYLFDALAALPLAEGVTLNFYSYLDFFGRLTANPAQFGLPANLDFATTCQAAAAFPSCSGYFSFDGTHPTAAVHQAVFTDIQEQFGFAAAAGGAVPEPATWAMMLLGFAFVGSALRGARQRRRVEVRFA